LLASKSPCAMCGVCFPKTHGNAKYCSRQCKDAASRKLKTCVVCCTEFRDGTGRQISCSKQCGRAHQAIASQKVEKQCRMCGIDFSTPKVTSHKVYCSMFCNERARRKKRHLYLNNAAKIRDQRIRENGFEKIDPLEVFRRDGWVCGICNKPIDRAASYPHPLSASVDHIKPVSKGGSHTLANVRCAHLSCNMKKSNKEAA
jgi:hypothetical protein